MIMKLKQNYENRYFLSKNYIMVVKELLIYSFYRLILDTNEYLGA